MPRWPIKMTQCPVELCFRDRLHNVIASTGRGNQSDFCKRTDVSPTLVTQYLSRKRQPGRATLAQMIRGCPEADWIYVIAGVRRE